MMKILLVCTLIFSCKSLNQVDNSANREYYNCFNADGFLDFQNDILEPSKWQNYIDFDNGKMPVGVLLSFNSEEEINLYELNLQDFLKYQNLVFPEDFINGIKSINGAALFKNGETESELISSDLDVDRFYFKTTYSSSSNDLIVKLNYEYIEDGNKYESTVNYYFHFDKCKMILQKVLVVN
ncbi:hypothetical protein JCM19296_2583 [Nonlabens ulvanivorans]|uniref:Uncharacterized protein n=2 Tax=Nonlabens TaxID=363408 RepID=A0A081DDI3_NONUL|nr:hypothetical protein JCM19296_2583 [Nonlabens ulvanivorans]